MEASCTGIVDSFGSFGSSGSAVEIVDRKRVASGSCWDTYSPGSTATASSSACLSVNLDALSHQGHSAEHTPMPGDVQL